MKKQEQDIKSTKICTECKTEKVINCFSPHKRERLGVRNWCKECVNQYNKEYRKNNTEKIKELRIKNKQYHKDYYKNNSEVLKIRVR